MKQFVLLFIALTALSCNDEPKVPENFDYGTANNGVYTNNYFNLRLEYDPSWNVQSKQQMDEISELGRELVNDDNLKKALKASEINNASLFMAYKYPEGTFIDYNPSFSLIAENVKNAPMVTSGKDYLIEAQKIMKQTQVNYDFDFDMERKQIGPHTFDVLNATGNYLDNEYQQQFMATITKDFCLLVVLSYKTEAQLAELESILGTLVFTDGKSKKKL
ncbi:hypothetical protein ACU8DI_02490 [Psychroserpens sp. BH13MA-6]